MNEPVISVIVPVYNVEKYLERCVDSIVAQTFREIEILLVDDGSTDGSGALCDRYLERDSRIRVLHKTNGGLSDARNAGIDMAKGTYCAFVDSDDFITENMLQVLYEQMIAAGADLSVCGEYDCYEAGCSPRMADIVADTCTGVKALGLLLEGKNITGSVCTKLIPAEVCRRHYFVTEKTYEDAFYMPELFIGAKKVAYTTQPLYYYWHRAGSITTRPFSASAMDVIEAYEYTLEMVEKHCPQLRDVAMFRLYWAHFVVLDRMLTVENYCRLPQYAPVVKYLKKHWREIVRCPYFQSSRRLAAVALRCHVKLYQLLLSLRDSKQKVHG